MDVEREVRLNGIKWHRIRNNSSWCSQEVVHEIHVSYFHKDSIQCYAVILRKKREENFNLVFHFPSLSPAVYLSIFPSPNFVQNSIIMVAVGGPK